MVKASQQFWLAPLVHASMKDAIMRTPAARRLRGAQRTPRPGGGG